MKKFILFLFLVTSFSIHNVYAQDGGDDFVDPTLEISSPNQPSSTSQGFESSTTTDPSTSTNFSTTNGKNSNNENAVSSEPLSFSEPLSDRQSVVDSNNNLGDVVVEQQADLTQSYKRRRGKHGVLFSVIYEKYFPIDYYSQFRDVYIENIFGNTDSIDLFGAEIGYKYNFRLGSIAILGNYAHGSKANESYSDGTTTRERNLSISRYGLSLNYAMDNIMEEPWIVPYGQVGVHQFQVVEDDLSQTDAKSATTQISFNYKIGLLFQLNWIEKSIDPNTQYEGLRSSGLQNTFLDVYAMTHMASSEVYDPADANSEGDPDMSSGMEIGVGLKLEF